jgi:hypothetical protein
LLSCESERKRRRRKKVPPETRYHNQEEICRLIRAARPYMYTKVLHENEINGGLSTAIYFSVTFAPHGAPVRRATDKTRRGAEIRFAPQRKKGKRWWRRRRFSRVHAAEY